MYLSKFLIVPSLRDTHYSWFWKHCNTDLCMCFSHCQCDYVWDFLVFCCLFGLLFDAELLETAGTCSDNAERLLNKAATPKVWWSKPVNCAGVTVSVFNSLFFTDNGNKDGSIGVISRSIHTGYVQFSLNPYTLPAHLKHLSAINNWKVKSVSRFKPQWTFSPLRREFLRGGIDCNEHTLKAAALKAWKGLFTEVIYMSGFYYFCHHCIKELCNQIFGFYILISCDTVLHPKTWPSVQRLCDL